MKWPFVISISLLVGFISYFPFDYYYGGGKFLSDRDVSISTVIFDFDGTIADSFSLLFDVVDKILEDLADDEMKERFNLHYPTPESVRTKSIESFMKKQSGMSLFELYRVYKEVMGRYEERIDEISLFEGVEDMLKNLTNEGYKLAVITKNVPHVVERFLRNFGLLKYFSLGVFSNNSLLGKAKTIKRFLRNKRVYKDEVVYVGDEVSDWKSANVLGIEVISVTYGFNSRELLESVNPLFLADSPSDVTALVSRIKEFRYFKQFNEKIKGKQR